MLKKYLRITINSQKKINLFATNYLNKIIVLLVLLCGLERFLSIKIFLENKKAFFIT